MRAPLSDDIVKVLQDDRAANKLVSTVLKERAAKGENTITIKVGGTNKSYKPVTAIHRKK